MTQSRRIAVTGGIGSGKSAVCELLRRRGYPVFSCDAISRALWRDPEYLRGIAALLPDCAEGGVPSREKVAARVFSDGEARRALEAYAHPKIMERLFAETEGCALSFSEVPLLFEGGYENRFDGVIALVRDEGERARAVAARDGVSEEEAFRRMRAQFDYSRIGEKDCVVIENGDLVELDTKLGAALCALGIR